MGNRATARSRGSAARRTLALGAGLALAGLLGAPSAAGAAGDADLLQLRAERLAAQGRCEEALPLLARVRAEDPDDARAALVAGQCQIRVKRYVEAQRSLQEARRLAPDDPEVELYLGMARFHVGDLEGARRTLEAAARRLPARPELDLYLGLLALQLAEAAEAAARLERARVAEPERFDPVASYYEGLAAASGGERRRARERLERVIDEHPGTIWAEQAEARLREMRDTRPAEWWVEATFGIEYDDNAVLKASEVVLPDEIPSKNDHRGVWSIEAGYELLDTPDWTVGVLATYYGNAHDDLEDFNVQFPGVSLWADRRLTESDTARLQYDFGYAWVGGSEPFLSIHTWTPVLYHRWSDGSLTRLFASFEKRNFFFSNEDVPDGSGTPGAPCPDPSAVICGPPGVDESSAQNRDGWGLSTGFDHTIPLFGAMGPREADADPAPGERNPRFFLRSGARFHRFSARGTEYSYDGVEALLAARVMLPFDFAFEANGSYEFRAYRNRSTFADPEDLFFNREFPLSGKDRSDDRGEIQVVLERRLDEYLTLSARYAWFDVASNVDVFDRNREVIGLYATVRFGP